MEALLADSASSRASLFGLAGGWEGRGKKQPLFRGFGLNLYRFLRGGGEKNTRVALLWTKVFSSILVSGRTLCTF